MHCLQDLNGVFSTYNQFSVAPSGEYVILKKRSDLLFYYEPENRRQNRELCLVIEDVVHRNDTIFDFAHLTDGRLILLMQSSPENRVHLAEASINLADGYVRIEQFAKEDIEIRIKGGQTKLIEDECGPVLISFPNNFHDESLKSRTVELFHINDFFQQNLDVVKCIRIDRRVANELWCNPFISRNCIYFFNQMNQEILCISVLNNQPTDRTRFSARLLRTHAGARKERPSANFFHRSVIVHEDFALVYFSQHVGQLNDQKHGNRKQLAEQLQPAWRLWLNSLVWEAIDTTKYAHLPVSKVSFKRSAIGSTNAYLHGHCAANDCTKKYHFFEVDMLNESAKKEEQDLDRTINCEKSKRQTLVRRFVKFASGRNQKNQLYRNKKLLATTLPTHVSYQSLTASNRPSSIGSSQQLLSKQTSSFSSSASCSNLFSWSRQMALQGSNRLSEQLATAKEYGYSDKEIWEALNLNNKNAHKPYEPFESISAMIDILSEVQKMGSTRCSTSSLTSPSRFPSSSTLPIYDDGRVAKTIPSWMSSSALSTLQPTNTAPAILSSRESTRSSSSDRHTHGVNRSMSFNDSFALRRSFPSASSTLGQLSGTYYSPQRTVKSSVQRLIDTFENENRRHFEEFQRINNELRRKLQNSINQEEHLQELLRLSQDKIRQQEVLVKSQSDSEKRLENANRRIQDLLKDIQLREADIIRQQGDYDALQRRHDAECRKAEEVRNTLNAEIGRLVRENERLSNLAQQNEMLKTELDTKDEEIRRLSGTNSEVERLNAEMARLVSEKRELEENQTAPICGVCMDNRREVIFMPCCHFICCKQCGDAMDHCTICRLRIMGKIEFFQ